MHWRLRWGRRTAPTNSPRKPDGDILAMNVIEEIHRKLPKHAPGDAWFILGAAGAAGHHQRQWRQDEADPGAVPVFRDPARHQERRPQDQHSIPTTAWRWTGQIRKVLNDNPEEFDPRKYLKTRDGRRWPSFASSGCRNSMPQEQASKIKKPLTPGRDGQALRQGRGSIPKGRVMASRSRRGRRPRLGRAFFLGIALRTVYFGLQGL